MALQGDTRQDTKSRVREPKKYQVIMHNDDYTPMDFVVEILIDIFHKEESAAVELMMTVHKSQRAVVGTYSYDIARSKVQASLDRARREGYPFRLTMREV